MRPPNIESDENYKIVTWTANTTGDQLLDEICELAACTIDSNFHKYIIPHCNVKKAHWKFHGLRIFNTSKFRFLIDSNTNEILNTETEIYGLKNFLLWLSEVKVQCSSRIILICYEDYNYTLDILWKSLEKYQLNDEFLELVAGFVNCNSIVDQKFKNEKNHAKHCISKIVSNKKGDMRSSLSRARVCYEILTYLKSGDAQCVGNLNGNYSEVGLLDFVKPFISDFTCIKSTPPIERKVAAKDGEVIRDEVTTFNKKLEAKSLNSKVGIKQTNLESNIKINSQPNVKEEFTSTNSCKYSVVSWAVNTTGYRNTDCIFQIAAVFQQFNFSQYIIPKRNIRNSYKYRIKVITENGSTYLENLQTQKVLQTNTELIVLTDFIKWLEEIKQSKSKDIILLYHEFQRHSITILLRTLQRCNLMNSFANVVIGFANIYDVLKEKCGNIINPSKLDNVSQVLLEKKATNISDATIRAELCYELIITVLKNNVDIHNSNNSQRGSEMYSFIGPYVTGFIDKMKEFQQLKKNTNAKRRLKRKKAILTDKDIGTPSSSSK